MKKARRSLVIIWLVSGCFISLVNVKQANATHAQGSDITYKCLGGDLYSIRVAFYRDCAGTSASTNQKVTFSSASCGTSFSVTLDLVAGTGNELDLLVCDSVTTACAGGTLPSVEEYVYQGNVTLPAQCSDWVLGSIRCCRNNAITTIESPNGFRLYVEAHINNLNVTCNNSPTFSNPPAAFVCVGQTSCFNNGAKDPDGDSLVYSLVNPLDNVGQNITYKPGYSPPQPLISTPSVTFNSLTGDICMTPTTLDEVTVTAIRVDEYRNGALIGSVVRDIQIRVIECDNILPISNGVNGSGSFSVDTNVCAGNPISFFIDTYDPDSNNVSLSWDTGIVGATFTVSAGQFPTGTFFWIPDSTDVGTVPHCFTISIRDDNCPYRGRQVYAICIVVGGVFATVAPQDTNISCVDSIILDASAAGVGGFSYLWSTGDTSQSIYAGKGTYTVMISDSVGCSTVVDTITISSSDAPFAGFIANNSVCLYDSVAFSDTSQGYGGLNIISWNWNFGDSSGSATQSPTHLYSDSGIYSVQLTVTNDSGCTDSTFKTIYIVPPPIVNAGSDTVICANSTAALSGLVQFPSGGFSTGILWTPGSDLSNPAILNPAASPDSTTNYTLFVTDNYGCASSDTVRITVGSLLGLSLSATSILCPLDSSGTATATVSGGFPPYTYLWNDPLSQTTSTATGLTSATFSVIITDSNTCDTSNILTIPQSPALTAVITKNEGPKCGQCGGHLHIDVGGGVPPYSFSIDTASPAANYFWNSATEFKAHDMCGAGTYIITFSDANGCDTTVTVAVAVKAQLTASIKDSTNIGCTGDNIGSAEVDASGGSTPYTYSWNTSPVQTTKIIDSLIAGTYCATVSDKDGCNASTVCVAITEPPMLTASITNVVNINCKGGNNGEATASPSGGTQPYTYNWNDDSSQSTATATGLTAGSYSVIITDSNDCSVTANVTINEPTALVASISSIVDVSCKDGNDGKATVSASGGTLSYTYLWNDPASQTTSAATGLTAGSYSVTVTDAKGCSATLSASITEPSQLIATITSKKDVSCNGGSDGKATATAVGGISPYTYLWNNTPPSNTASVSIFPAGSFTVTITDNKGCQATANVIINEPTALILSMSVVNANCGNSDGSATVSASGGKPPYGYFWNTTPIQNTAAATGLPSGSYEVTVTDSNGCAEIATAIINNLDVSLTLNPVTNASCYGDNDGAASVTATGGTIPYTYNWSSGQTTSAITGLTAGSYSITATDAAGCKISLIATINQPLPVISSISKTNVKCKGGTDGAISATVSGEYPSYTYQWNPGGYTTPAITGISSGSYSITVTDGIGCDTSLSINITEPTALLASISSYSNASCNGADDGSATVSASGGIISYSYSWNDPASQSSATAGGLAPGSYTITVKDANNCIVSTSAAITEPAVLGAAISDSIDVTCNGADDGQATVSVSGGTMSYTYIWNTFPVQSTPAADNLPPGNYTVTVIDANGCDTSASVAITEPSVLTGSITLINNVRCKGFNDGFAVAAPSGGILPYTYKWDDPSAQTDSIADSLVAGSYKITITDANGCFKTLNVTITEPTLLTITVDTVINVSCNGANDGEIAVSAGGGQPAYTYSWNYDLTETDNDVEDLIPGNYIVTVTDANSCVTTSATNITEPAVLLAIITDSADISCNGENDGTATVTVSGGTTAYTYLWNDPASQTTSVATGLPPGYFTVKVTDNNSCENSDGVLITEPAPLIVAITSSTNSSCNGANNGQATAMASGGIPSYSYVWNTTPPQYTSAITGLSPGTYVITVVDSNDCLAADTVSITQPLTLTASIISIVNINCKGDNTGAITVDANGGSLPYSYQWNDVSSQTTAQATGLTAGNYTVSVQDVNGCTVSSSAAVNEPAAVLSALISDSVDVSCNGGSNGSAKVTVSGGSPLYTYLWNDPNSRSSASATGLITGCYTVLVTDAKGCDTTANVCIDQPAGLSAIISASTNVSCYNADDGNVTVSASGGTQPYTYSWTSGGGTDSTATGLSPANYTVTVTDTNGCSKTTSVTITEPPPLVGGLPADSIIHVSCKGGSDGKAFLTAYGGTSPYTYLWNDPLSQTTPTADSLPAGIHTVFLSDFNGCLTSLDVTINEPPLLTAAILLTSGVKCNGDNNAEAITDAGGGTPPYTYLWNDPLAQTDSLADSLSAGSYTVTVTDFKGCSKTAGITGPEPAVIVAMITDSTDVSCNGANDGSAKAAASGGTPFYTYLWNDPLSQTAATAVNMSPATYTVTVTDANGCDTTAIVTITEPAPIVATITGSTNISCKGANDGDATVTPSGGTMPYKYLWNTVPTQTTPVATALSPGTYISTVTDTNGCTAADTVLITEPVVLSAVITSVIHVKCKGEATGAASVNASGGTPPYAYLWNDPASQTTGSATGLTAGTYIVTVTDNNSCKKTVSTTINEPAAFLTAIITDSSNVKCNGGSTGSATVTASGGTPFYNYLWNDAGSQTTKTATGLAAVNYSVIVTDANGCDTATSITINEPALLTSNIVDSANASCKDSANGDATVNGAGGTLPYTYLWNTNPSQTDSVATALKAGTYNITIKDKNNCSSNTSVVISEPDSLKLSFWINDANCGNSDGDAAVIATGGTLPYTYLWGAPSSSTNDTIYDVVSGVYPVTVTDSKACVEKDFAFVNDIVVFTVQDSSDFLRCFGGADGAIRVYVTSGTAPFDYFWSTGDSTFNSFDTSDTLSNLKSGIYYITIRDTNDCKTTKELILNSPEPIVGDKIIKNTSCFGFSDATATILANGGTAPYTYLWNTSPAQTDSIATGLSAGTYNVTVTDFLSCDTVATVDITEPALLVATAAGIIDVSCKGDSTAKATVSVSGGTPVYTYTWNDPGTQADSTATGLFAGSFMVTIIDSLGCDTTENITITEPAILGITITNIQNVSCNGANDGMATASVTGGNPSYSYSWMVIPAQTDSTASGLSPTTQFVNITDSKGCTAIDSVLITEPAVLIAAIDSVSHVSCKGGNNGSAALTASGGTIPYSYSWNTIPVQTDSIATGLAAAIYKATITDANGCIDSVTVTINEPDFLVAAVSIVDNVSCKGGGNGKLSATALGGTSPYSFLWDDSFSQTNALATGLAAGIYQVTVTDSKGCDTVANGTITEPLALSPDINITNVTCKGDNNGYAIAVPAGGILPYTYVWMPGGQLSDSIGGLFPGTYTLTLLDSNSCDTSRSITITEPDSLIVSLNSVTLSCFNDSTGAVVTNAAGGTLPYTYLWNTTPAQTDSFATGLAAGNYSLNVSDINGCLFILPVSVGEHLPVISEVVKKNISCFGLNDGTVTIIVSEEASVYTYLWDDPSSQITEYVTGLTPGIYNVTVTDNFGCDTIASHQIFEPPVLASVITDSANVTCKSKSDGWATVAASGGRFPYSYLWTDTGNQVTTTATGLIAGFYVITVTDSSGCKSITNVTITEPLLLAAVITDITQVSCNGICDGSATGSASGGTSPYSYFWNTTPFQSAITATGLCAGSYMLSVLDSNDCSSSITGIGITQPDVLTLGISLITHVRCFGIKDGQIEASAGGGTSPFTFSWNPAPAGLTDSTATSLDTGTYTIIVIDTNGCSDTVSAAIDQPPLLTVNISDSTFVSCFGGNNATATIAAAGGSLVYTYLWNDGLNQKSATASGLYAGSYTATVTDNKGCVKSDSVIITEPTLLTGAITYSSNAKCKGNADGAATVTPSGGLLPYSYLWNDDSLQAAASATGLAAGTYIVTITDSMACVRTVISVITEPVFLTVSFKNVSNVKCKSDSTGSASVSTFGGTPPYTYLWSTPDAAKHLDSLAMGIPLGTYTVAVTDSLGCDTLLSFSITEPDTLIGNIHSIANIRCFGDSTGKAVITATGGSPPYSYLWLPSTDSDSGSTGLIAGMNYINLRDSLNCLFIDSVLITSPPEIVITTANDDTICVGMTAVISATGTGGVGALVPSWNDTLISGTGPDTVAPVTPTNYIVTFTDSLGCNNADTVTITVNSILVVFSIPDSVCFGDSTIISTSISGGDGKYSLTWSTGDTSVAILVNPLVTTTYAITVTDGCGSPTALDSVTVDVNPYPVIKVSPLFASGCEFATINFKDVKATIPGSTYIWDLGDSAVSTNHSPTHSYTTPGVYNVSVSVTSPKGCTTNLSNMSTVLISPTPDAAITADPQTTTALFPTISFYDVSTTSTLIGDSISIWNWDFGDGADTNIRNPKHTYEIGTYNVELLIINQYGCKDTAIVTVIVAPDARLYIPSAFSPNGDGTNDIFSVKGIGIDNIDMYIYDRWGALVFYSDNLYIPWDGTVANGTQIAQHGVYVYIIRVKTALGEIKDFVGTVTLVR